MHLKKPLLFLQWTVQHLHNPRQSFFNTVTNYPGCNHRNFSILVSHKSSSKRHPRSRVFCMVSLNPKTPKVGLDTGISKPLYHGRLGTHCWYHYSRWYPGSFPYTRPTLVYTMDNEVVPRPCKIYDWLLNSSRDHFSLHQGKNFRVTIKFEVPIIHILRPTLSTDMVQYVLQWERQKRCCSRERQPMVEKCCYKKFLMIFFLGGGGRENEDKRRQELEFFSKLPFLDIYEKNISTFTFWCILIPLGPHLVYT
jgi:hypothetical protein